MYKIIEKDFAKFPICVDLDGTLWPGDCLHLCLKNCLKKYPFKIFHLLFWWFKGRTYLKHNLLKLVSFNPDKLPFFPEILQYLHSLKQQGAKLYLITGSDQQIADKVSRYLNIFEEAYGSTLGNNLVGENKADLLNFLFGKQKYIYFGNEWKDRLVWRYCAAAVAIDVDQKTLEWLNTQSIYTRRFICKP